MYSKFLKRLQIYFLNQISNYYMHSKLKLTTLHLINKDFLTWINSFSQFSSVAPSCPTLYDPMDRSTPGLPVHHQLLEFTQTHVHWVSDAIQPSYPLLSLFFLPSITHSIRVFSNESILHIRWPNIGFLASAWVLPMNIQDWFPLRWTGWISLQTKGLSRVFSNTTVQKHQFFGTQLSL